MKKTIITEAEREILEHTLGIGRGGNRNHFVAGENHSDMPTIRSLIEKGFMFQSALPAFLSPKDMVFEVTAAGKAALKEAV